AVAFQAGQIAHCIDAWKEITMDLEILTSVSGEIIPFSTIPLQGNVPFQPVWKGPKCNFIDNEILSLLNKGVIIPSQHKPGEFISPIFLCDKRGSSFRMILNLKTLNEHVQYHHFKMETVETVASMMTLGCFMASIDLKDAYYCVPVSKKHQK
ncbi:Hypothetical predicted protein, partial [Paramuricea clavata]